LVNEGLESGYIKAKDFKLLFQYTACNGYRLRFFSRLRLLQNDMYSRPTPTTDYGPRTTDFFLSRPTLSRSVVFAAVDERVGIIEWIFYEAVSYRVFIYEKYRVYNFLVF